jgi:hypothetical protein
VCDYLRAIFLYKKKNPAILWVYATRVFGLHFLAPNATYTTLQTAAREAELWS